MKYINLLKTPPLLYSIVGRYVFLQYQVLCPQLLRCHKNVHYNTTKSNKETTSL